MLKQNKKYNYDYTTIIHLSTSYRVSDDNVKPMENETKSQKLILETRLGVFFVRPLVWISILCVVFCLYRRKID